METYGKTFAKRVACDNQKAKKLPTKPIALEEVGKWSVSGLCLLAAFRQILENMR